MAEYLLPSQEYSSTYKVCYLCSKIYIALIELGVCKQTASAVRRFFHELEISSLELDWVKLDRSYISFSSLQSFAAQFRTHEKMAGEDLC